MAQKISEIKMKADSFSDLLACERPMVFEALQSQEICRSTAWEIFAPECVAMNKLQDAYRQGCYNSTAICFAAFQNVLIDSQLGVCMPVGGDVILESTEVARIINPDLSQVSFLSSLEGLDIIELEGPVLHLFHRASPAYGHFIYDCYAVLLFLKAHILSEGIRILLPSYFPAWGRKMIEYAGFPAENIVTPTASVISCSRVIIPNTMTVANAYYPHPAVTLCLKELKRSGQSSRKVYLTRRGQTNYSDRVIENEDEVIAYLSSQGFEIVEPGNLPFETQLEIFGNASIIVSAHGSALANVAFARPGTIVVDLMPSEWIGLWGDNPEMKVERWVFNLTSLFNLNYYVVLHSSRREPVPGGGLPRVVSSVEIPLLEQALLKAEASKGGWWVKLAGFLDFGNRS